MKVQGTSVNNAGYGKFRVDLNDNARVLSADDMFFEMTGYSIEDIESHKLSFYDIIYQTDLYEFKENIVPQLIKTGRCVIEGKIKTKKNDSKSVITYGAFNNMQGIIDMTILYAEPKELSELKYNTEIFGATHTDLKISEILKQPNDDKHSFILIKMNNYKAIVDAFGLMFTDSAIDNIIRNIIHKMKKFYQSIIGRINCDMILIFLKNEDRKAAEKCCEMISELFKKSYMGSSKVTSIDYSMGISFYPNDGREYLQLVMSADKAAFVAFKQGKKYGIYNSEDTLENYVPIEPFDYLQINKRNYDFGFIAHAVSLLSHSRDMDSSLNLLLETTGLNYDIHTILISEYDSHENIMRQTNFWSRNGGVDENVNTIESPASWDNFMSGFDSRGFMAINDTDGDWFSDNDREFFKAKKIRAAINCLLMDGDKIIGYMSYCDQEKVRHWSKYEKDTFFELSKLISFFISMRIENRRKSEKIYALSHDHLTGLLNMQSFMDKALSMIRAGKNEDDVVFAVAYTDINNFAYLNDNFGFAEGNKILCSFAEKMKSVNNLIACRAAADRFISISKNKSKEAMINAVSRINTEYSAYLKERYPVSDLSISTGICFMMPGDFNLTAAVDNANLIRKEIKQSRETSFAIYDEELKKKRMAELAIIGSVHDAINNGNIEPFLQAKCALNSRKVIGAEALVRWRNDDGTLKYPDQFIPPLERVGYIVDVDFCIYEQVLKRLAKWKADGKKLLPISVNFSRMHMKYKNFVERVCELAAKYGVDRKYVEIEITESTLSDDKGDMLDCMSKLQKSGFKIDIDDFGTGYSSLNMLLEAPADIVKIDKCFIDKTDSPAGKSYIRQIGDLVIASNKDIIFEGVETEEQADFLLDCGYNKIQGYLFDRPIPADEFEKKYIYSE